MNYLGDYYKKINDYEEMKKYYLMATYKGNCIAMNSLENYYKNKVLIFDDLLKTIKNKNKLITRKINELKQTKYIIIYENKIRLFKKLNNYNKYVICLEDGVLNINLDCGHEVCVECYKSITKCHYKCLN
jgi:hypothetical protein